MNLNVVNHLFDGNYLEFILKKHVKRESWKKALLVSLVGVACTVTAMDAFAGGFAVARFGGSRGTSVDTNPTTLYYNPAAASFSLKGTQVFLDASMAYRTASFFRSSNQTSPYPAGNNPFGPGGVLEQDKELAKKANTGLSTLSNFLVIPMAGVTTDFGLDMPLRVGAAFFVPFGGSAVWDESPDAAKFKDKFRGATDGTVRWFSIDGTVQTMAIAGGVSYQIESLRLGFGATFNTYLTKVETLRARNATNTDHLVDTSGAHLEGRTSLKAKSLDFGMGLGLMAEPIKDKLWVGLSWQSRPNFTGEMYLHGELVNIFGTSPPSPTNKIQMTWTLPDVYRLGLRVNPSHNLELKLNFDYTRWSVFDQQCVVSKKDGKSATKNQMQRVCETNDEGDSVNKAEANDPSILQNIQRHWRDTFSVRLDAKWQALTWLAPSLGVSFDSNAIPSRTLDPALMDMNKVTTSIGSEFNILDWLDLEISLSNVFYFKRDTTKEAYYPKYKGNSKQPGNGGVYKQNTLVLNTNMMFSF